MRVGFDARALVSPAAGVRRYTRELFGAMAAIDGVEVIAAGARSGADLPPGVTCMRAGFTLPTNAGWMLTGLPQAARAARVDVFHAPAYTAPLGGPRPLVLTIHDISYERHPEWYPYRRDPVRRAFYRWSARAADRIITDSEFSRQEIVAGYGLASERIEVVPLAASPSFRPGPPAPAGASPYVLHVGDLHLRRNLDVAVRALLQVRTRRSDLEDLRLVLAGVDRGAATGLHATAAHSAGGQGLVEFAGRVDDGRLLELYRGAAALLYPSLYEGFGLPLLEAMACGTPVIGARAASIPEVTGGAAILLDPHDVAAWADAIEAVLDGPVAARLREAGLRRAAELTWRRTAEATIDVYERALGRR
jgi:alpha-1,3-rhamnosyl/mannosyltransferase